MKYPAIYKSAEGSEYLYQNKDSYYCYERQVWDLSELHHDCHHSDINITAEYLANTYGEVKSKAHAEFIVKLAENTEGMTVCRDHVFNSVGAGCLFSFDSAGELNFWVNKYGAAGASRKQITIPLPPECEERKPKEVIANGKKHTLNLVTGFYDFGVIELGYAAGSTLEKLQEADDYQVLSFVDECDDGKEDEWPKVNDIVSLRYRFDSKQIMYTGELLYLSSNHIIIKTENGNDCHCIRSEWDIEKPKTPEQELRDEIIDDLGKIIQRGTISIVEFLSKYNVTKKPQ